MEEIWKDVKGYENKYQISSFGRVKSLVNNKGKYREKILKPYLDGDGYEIIRLSQKGVYKAYKVHRLVAMHFIKNAENKEFVDHIDTNRRNNNCNNLRWVTAKENSNNSNTIINLKKIGIKYKTLYGKKVINEKGEIFISIIEASRQTNMSRATIQRHLKEKTGVWCYV